MTRRGPLYGGAWKIGKILLQSGLWVLILAFSAFAQSTSVPDYPTQTIKIVVPFSAGSNTDILARSLGDKLASLWKQTVIVENKPGIAGTVSAANSAPDGYTLMLTSNGHTIIKILNKEVGIDPVTAFTGVAEVASIPMVLIVPPNSSATNLKEFFALAKEKPGQLNFASAGVASSAYIAGELLKQTAGIDIVHIPYKGTPEQLQSVMRSDAQMAMAFVGTALGLIQSGQVRALAIASSQRYPSLPNVPTFAEAGFPEYQYDSWFGVMAPAKTPAPIVRKVSEAIASILKDPDIQKTWETLGAVPVFSTPEKFDQTIKSDADRYVKLFEAAGIDKK
jgi:tripartite-type tricarboxylate transporter receptor subunit TctC